MAQNGGYLLCQTIETHDGQDATYQLHRNSRGGVPEKSKQTKELSVKIPSNCIIDSRLPIVICKIIL